MSNLDNISEENTQEFPCAESACFASHASSQNPKTTSQKKYDSCTSEHANSAFLRAENEDDDGYDPYSDRISYEPLFERDPWR